MRCGHFLNPTTTRQDPTSTTARRYSNRILNAHISSPIAEIINHGPRGTSRGARSPRLHLSRGNHRSALNRHHTPIQTPKLTLRGDISETEFQITVTLDLPDAKEEDEPPKFLLSVRFPEEYPDEAPQLDIKTAPGNASATEHFSVSEDRDQLLSSLDETIQENLGMAMIFTLVSALKDAAEQLIQERKDAVAREHEEQLLAAEREENKKFQGTPVTPETFLKWREGFLKEMKEKRQREEEERLLELKKAKVKEPVKLSGRQLWERGLAGKGTDDDYGDDDEMPTDGVEKLSVEAA